MPIRPEHRFFYPIDWPQLSDAIRFRRAGGWCEECARPHPRRAFHLGDGRWWDAEISGWRDGQGRWLRQRLRDEDADLAAFCRRCHMVHDRDEHQRRRWRTLFRRKAMGDLFQGPYLAA